MNDDDEIINDDEIIVEELKIKGLYYVADIKENTYDIINELDNVKWEPISNSKNSRLVQQYGYKYNYISSTINEKCDKLPTFLNKFKDLLTDICLELNIINNNYIFNQCIINNYYQGQGISPHIDLLSFGGVIGCFTIGSGTTMVFKNKNEQVEIYVEPNSLYIMSSDARYKWFHSMPIKKFDIINNIKIERTRRISITFRNILNTN